ncbi:MAG: branched-chain amino acid ABC transporter permease [Betaproteobacteria bacterium]|nr:MAG: branched-chain amino acid ABC transporter permease [Betaproteobacteria bacterium]
MKLFPAAIDWRAPRTLVAVFVLIALLLLPLLMSGDSGSFYVKFITRVMIYALAAIGLNFILGFGGMVSLGHAMYVMLGAYAVAIPAQHGIVSGWAQLSIALVATAVLAAVIGAVALRTTGIAFIMITLAFAQMLFFGAVSLKDYGGDDGLTLAARSDFALFDLSSNGSLYYVTLFCVVLALYLSWRAVLSPFGLVLRGSKSNTRRAAALGHPVFRYQLVAYVASALACAVAGVLLANLTQFASPAYGAWTLSGELIVIVILGGLGTVFGPLIGAILLLSLEEILPMLVELTLPDYKSNWMLLLGAFIFIIALVLKRGVFGSLSASSATHRKGDKQ